MGFSEKYDTYYDDYTGEWDEDACSDPECEYCSNRPDKYEGKLIVDDGLERGC